MKKLVLLKLNDGAVFCRVTVVVCGAKVKDPAGPLEALDIFQSFQDPIAVTAGSLHGLE